jgi:hypothetical protein
VQVVKADSDEEVQLLQLEVPRMARGRVKLGIHIDNICQWRTPQASD